jgi:hypothetical protein
MILSENRFPPSDQVRGQAFFGMMRACRPPWWPSGTQGGDVQAFDQIEDFYTHMQNDTSKRASNRVDGCK